MEQQRFVRKNTNVFETQRRNEKKHTRRTVFYVILFLSVTVVFLGVCFAVFLNVSEITVVGNEKYSAEEIISYVPIEPGENIYLFDAEATEELIKQKLPFVGDIEIERDLPSTIVLNVTEEKPIFAIDLAGSTFILSSELKVLEKTNVKAEQTGLAVLRTPSVQKCMVGEIVEFVDERTYDAIVELYDSLEAEYINEKLRSVDAESRFDIYINYDNRFDVYVGDTVNINLKIRFLVGIIDKLGEKTKGTIDISEANEAAVALS